jgi:DNA-binding NtrC family response regulator
MKRKVLILDDDPDILKLLEEYLLKQGWKVSLAQNSQEAISLIKRQKIQVALVDLALQGTGGNRFIVQAKAINPHMKFAIHTGTRNQKLPRTLVNMGILKEHIFLKPVADLSLIHAALTSLLMTTPDFETPTIVDCSVLKQIS